MGYVVLTILLLLFSWIIYKNPFKAELSKKELLIGWGIKLSVSVTFILIFTQIYTNDGMERPYGDVGNFFDDSRIIADYGKKEPVGYLKLLFGIDANNIEVMEEHLSETRIWSYGDNGDLLNDNRLILRINSIIHFISLGNIWVHVIIFSFLSFIGTLLLFRAFQDSVHYKKAFYFALLLTPTIAFWNSGLTKEALFFLAFSAFAFIIRKMTFNARTAVFLLIVLTVLLINKTHLGIVLIPMSIILLIGYKTGYKRSLAAIFTIGILSLLIFTSLVPNEKINAVDRMSQKQQDLINLAKGGVFFITDSFFCAFDYEHLDNFEYEKQNELITVKRPTKGEYKLFGQDEFYPFEISASEKAYEVYLVQKPSKSYVDVEPINDSFGQLLKNTPMALVNVLIRPFPNDPGSGFKHVVFIENLAFLAFLIFVIGRRRKDITSKDKVWIFYMISSSIILMLIIGWTIPVLGAIVRYKMATQMLLILALFLTLGPKKEKSK